MSVTIQYEYNYTEQVNGNFISPIGPVLTATGPTITIEPGPVRNNYIFLCWNTKSDGTGIDYYPGDKVSEDLTLYAIWEPVTYLTTHSTLTSIANAIRANNGESTLYSFTEGFINGIENIENSLFFSYVNGTLISINLSNVFNIPRYAFGFCSELTTVNFPDCTAIENYAFNSCSSLTSVNFPVCTIIGSYAFDYCDNLTSINFPACITIGRFAFGSCSSLTSVNFPVCTIIGSDAFYDCSNLTSIYLNNSSICSLSSSNAFYSTQITSTTGSIYVPASLLTEYQSAPKWSYFSTRFFSIP